MWNQGWQLPGSTGAEQRLRTDVLAWARDELEIERILLFDL